jgi:MaoC like domain
MEDAGDRVAVQPRVTGGPGLETLVAAELAPSEWLTLGRREIGLFDEATFHGPSTNYGGAEGAEAAHGTHTLALLPPLFEQAVAIKGFSAVVLAGFERVRFPAPVPVGARVRVHFEVMSVSEARGGYECRVAVTGEREASDRPVCVCEMILRLFE